MPEVLPKLKVITRLYVFERNVDRLVEEFEDSLIPVVSHMKLTVTRGKTVSEFEVVRSQVSIDRIKLVMYQDLYLIKWR